MLTIHVQLKYLGRKFFNITTKIRFKVLMFKKIVIKIYIIFFIFPSKQLQSHGLIPVALLLETYKKLILKKNLIN